MAAGGNVVSEKENKRLEFTVSMKLYLQTCYLAAAAASKVCIYR